MARFIKYLFTLLVLIAGISAGGYYLLFTANIDEPDVVPAIDITHLRQLTEDGPKPVKINSDLITSTLWPKQIFLAGASWDKIPLDIYVFSARYSDGSRVLIDTALDKAASENLKLDDPVVFHDDAYARMLSAMGDARKIVLTHEHMDHIGGLAAHPEGLSRTALSQSQKDHPEKMVPVVFAEGALDQAEIYPSAPYHLVAPGIVAIKAAGHTPGSQMIYVRQEDGQEFLFVGDIVWHMDGIRGLTARPYIVSTFILEEDRDAVARQIYALNHLHRTQPDVNLVVAHDRAQIRSYIDQGLMGAQLQ